MVVQLMRLQRVIQSFIGRAKKSHSKHGWLESNLRLSLSSPEDVKSKQISKFQYFLVRHSQPELRWRLKGNVLNWIERVTYIPTFIRSVTCFLFADVRGNSALMGQIMFWASVSLNGRRQSLSNVPRTHTISWSLETVRKKTTRSIQRTQIPTCL